MRCGPTVSGRTDELGERLRPRLEELNQRNGLVEYSDTAYDRFHVVRLPSHYLRRQ